MRSIQKEAFDVKLCFSNQMPVVEGVERESRASLCTAIHGAYGSTRLIGLHIDAVDIGHSFGNRVKGLDM
jgi:hypothetical protein